MNKESLKRQLGITAGVVLLLGAGIYIYSTSLKGDAASDLASDLSSRTFIDEDGKTFEVNAKPGMGAILSPSGKQGYLAEFCWWTKDGKVRETPFPVLLNEFCGKPGPTFCPDCGRLVVVHNPSPKVPGSSIPPPPTASEMSQKKQ